MSGNFLEQAIMIDTVGEEVLARARQAEGGMGLHRKAGAVMILSEGIVIELVDAFGHRPADQWLDEMADLIIGNIKQGVVERLRGKELQNG